MAKSEGKAYTFVPFISRSWEKMSAKPSSFGNASDNAVFKERCEVLMEQFSKSETPRYLVADSKLYTKKNASNLAHLPFITRIPETLKVAQQVIDQAWDSDQAERRREASPALLCPVCWQSLAESPQCPGSDNKSYSYQRVDLCHYDIEQRWLVAYSDAAFKKAEKTLAKAQAKEHQKVKSRFAPPLRYGQKQLFHLQAQRLDSRFDSDPCSRCKEYLSRPAQLNVMLSQVYIKFKFVRKNISRWTTFAQ